MGMFTEDWEFLACLAEDAVENKIKAQDSIQDNVARRIWKSKSGELQSFDSMTVQHINNIIRWLDTLDEDHSFWAPYLVNKIRYAFTQELRRRRMLATNAQLIAPEYGGDTAKECMREFDALTLPKKVEVLALAFCATEESLRAFEDALTSIREDDETDGYEDIDDE